MTLTMNKGCPRPAHRSETGIVLDSAPMACGYVIGRPATDALFAEASSAKLDAAGFDGAICSLAAPDDHAFARLDVARRAGNGLLNLSLVGQLDLGDLSRCADL